MLQVWTPRRRWKFFLTRSITALHFARFGEWESFLLRKKVALEPCLWTLEYFTYTLKITIDFSIVITIVISTTIDYLVSGDHVPIASFRLPRLTLFWYFLRMRRGFLFLLLSLLLQNSCCSQTQRRFRNTACGTSPKQSGKNKNEYVKRQVCLWHVFKTFKLESRVWLMRLRVYGCAWKCVEVLASYLDMNETNINHV